MILAGDEFGQTQQGNNNAYCQDNDLTWLNWDNADQGLIAAATAALALRQKLDGFIDTSFGNAEMSDGKAIRWLHPEGREMSEVDWHDGGLRIFAKRVVISGGADVLLILNAGDAAEFSLPGGDWAQQLDTSAIDPAASATLSGTIQVDWQSVLVLAQGGPA